MAVPVNDCAGQNREENCDGLCPLQLWLLPQWWAGLNRTSANISRRVGSNEAIPIHIDCVPLYRSHSHTDAKHRHIFRASILTQQFICHLQAYPPLYSMHTKLPITQSICICIIYADFLLHIDSSRLEMFIPVSFPVQV